MPKFEINYTKKSYYVAYVDAQNENQVRFLFENNELDLSNERFGDSELDEIRSINKCEVGDDE